MDSMLSDMSTLALLQAGSSSMTSDALRMLLVTALFLAVVITLFVLVLRYTRAERNSSAAEKVREEFEKSKETLLAAAMAKKQASQESDGQQREVTAEEQERELLREAVDPDRVIGLTCTICGLEMAADEELVIDPYTGTGYHLSSFLSDWPLDAETHKPLPRPRYIYRYPQGTVVRSSDLVHSY
jgi:hypothetical protein